MWSEIDRKFSMSMVLSPTHKTRTDTHTHTLTRIIECESVRVSVRESVSAKVRFDFTDSLKIPVTD